jgi:hypothetical protein
MRKVPTATTLTQSDNNETEWKTLASAFVLGEALIDSVFKDTIMDALRAKVCSTSGHTMWSCGGEMVKMLYEGTPEGSAAGKFMVDVYTLHAGEKELELVRAQLPKDFFYDMFVLIIKGSTTRPLNDFPGTWTCKYHGHKPSEPCYLNSMNDG